MYYHHTVSAHRLQTNPMYNVHYSNAKEYVLVFYVWIFEQTFSPQFVRLQHYNSNLYVDPNFML